MGVFHTICSLFGTLGKMIKGSGIAEIIIESGFCASGSLDRIATGKHFNRAVRVHKLVLEAFEILLLERFEEDHPRDECLSKDAFNMVIYLINNPGTETASELNFTTRRNSEVTLRSTKPSNMKHLMALMVKLPNFGRGT